MPVSFIEHKRGWSEEVKQKGSKSCKISPGLASLRERMY